MTKVRSKIKTDTETVSIVRTLLEEIRSLRYEINLLVPHEDLDEYAHPHQIKQAYEKAIRVYPPSAV